MGVTCEGGPAYLSGPPKFVPFSPFASVDNWRRWSVAEHEQYKAGALKRKRQVKQSGNILK